VAKGMDVMVTSVENGLNAMPPKGMCFDCSADDFKALIEYMAKAK
jgi:cytochrome c5